jgi:hypothetical protein
MDATVTAVVMYVAIILVGVAVGALLGTCAARFL